MGKIVETKDADLFVTVEAKDGDIKVHYWYDEPEFNHCSGWEIDWVPQSHPNSVVYDGELSRKVSRWFTPERISEVQHLLKFNVTEDEVSSVSGNLCFWLGSIFEVCEYTTYKFIAVDSDGTVALFKEEPEFDHNIDRWVSLSKWVAVTRVNLDHPAIERYFDVKWDGIAQYAKIGEARKFIDHRINETVSSSNDPEDDQEQPDYSPQYIAVDEDGTLCSFAIDPVFEDGKWSGEGRTQVYRGCKVGIDVSRLSVTRYTNKSPGALFSKAVESAQQILKKYESIITAGSKPVVVWGHFTIEAGANSEIRKRAKGQLRRFISEHYHNNHCDGLWVINDPSGKIFTSNKHPNPHPTKGNSMYTEWGKRDLDFHAISNNNTPLKFWVPGWFLSIMKPGNFSYADIIDAISDITRANGD